MPYLAFNLNDGNEFIFDLLEERLSLGRNPGNEIVIDNNQISSFHAEFARQPGGAYLLTDLKSSNGTYVNGRRVEYAELKSGDRVRFGQFEARFRDRFIPGRGRERKGPAPSAEEKRRAAESSGEPRSRTDFIPLADKSEETGAVRGGTANGHPIAPASHAGMAGNSIPKPAPASPQHRPDNAAQSVTLATEDLHKQQASLQAELVKLEAQIKTSGEESTRQRKLFESEKRELEEALAMHREHLKTAELGVTELESRRAEAEKRIKEVAEAGGSLKSTSEALQRVVAQRSAAEIALAALKAAHELEQQRFNDTSAGHAGVRRQHEEAKLELTRLRDALSATEKRAAEAMVRTAEVERQFVERQAGLQESQASRIQEFDATFAEKQSAVEAADGRLRELEARRAGLETKTAELAETERKLADLRNEISGHESKRADLAGLIKALATERGAHEAEIRTLSAERERRETGLGELAARERDLRNSVGTLENEMEVARARFEELRKLNGEAEQSLTTRQIDLVHAVAEKESSLRSLEERIAQLAPLGEEFAIKQRALSAADSRLQDANKALLLLEEQKDALERTVASQTRQREEKEREITGLAEQVAAQHTLLEALSKQIARFEESVAIRQRRVEAANNYLAGIDSRAAEIEAKSAAHQAELESARAGLTQASADLESLRSEIRAAASAKGKLLAELDEVQSRLQGTHQRSD